MSIPTKAVKAIIKNLDNKILLMQSNPAVREGNNPWDLPGGLIDEGEGNEETLIREVREETSLQIKIIRQSGEYRFLRPKDGQWVTAKTYICEIIGGEFNISEEHVRFGWLGLDEIKKLKVKDPSFLEALEKELK